MGKYARQIARVLILSGDTKRQKTGALQNAGVLALRMAVTKRLGAWHLCRING
jgi:hypothetical protein